ncbi:hypothetical protein [Longimicrobium sp.]|uniref:hypothetical protein n=1 Tax=Longimicrobium sp. TaxID=2029185 RepID=UPI002CD8431F|nr:hypothetical protein [Longimicrobium sp.]HSU13505.1 hypothetical protein [Longimicrobium sp.]
MRSTLAFHAVLFTLTTTSARAQQTDQLADPQAPAGRHAVGCSQVADYVPGTAAAGEFTVSDCFSLNAGLRQPTDYWRFHTDVRRDVQAVVEAPGMQVHLRLLTDDGVEVKADEFVNSFAILSTQVPPGTYRLEVENRSESSGGGRAFGRYTLRSSTDVAGFEGCPKLETLPSAGLVAGEWSVEDCLLPTMMRYDLRRHDYYVLDVTSRRDVALSLESPGVTSTLALFTRTGEPVADAMVAGEPGRISAQLAPGAYVVRIGVASGAERETGRYTLRVR